MTAVNRFPKIRFRLHVAARQDAVVPILVPVRISVGAWISLRSLVRLPPFLLLIHGVGRRNVRLFLVHAPHGNLRVSASTLVVIIGTVISSFVTAKQGTRLVIVSSLVFGGRLGSLLTSRVFTVVLRLFFRKLYSNYCLLFEKMRHCSIAVFPLIWSRL